MNNSEEWSISERLIKCLKTGALSAEERKEVEELHQQVLGRRIRACNCPDKYMDALIEIQMTMNRLLKRS